MERVIILGSGPAGCTAALYASRAELSPLVLEGIQPGGQLTITTEVENYPGFPKGIMGPQLMLAMKEQAEKFGTRFITTSAIEVDLSHHPFTVKGDNGEVYQTQSLIIATGASAKLLGLPKEKELMGRGVSACATCDGFFFKDKEIAVVGGGDTAMEEAIFLTKFARKVTVIHRRDALRASQIMQERALKNPKIEFLWNTVVEGLISSPEEKLQGLMIRNVKTQQVREMPIEGLFIAIGHQPNTQIFQGLLEMDPQGYIITKPFSTHTSQPGVFACGDVVDKRYRQAITAAGTGCMAAMDCEHYLASLE